MNWDQVNWALKNSQIALQLGCHPVTVSKKRIALKQPRLRSAETPTPDEKKARNKKCEAERRKKLVSLGMCSKCLSVSVAKPGTVCALCRQKMKDYGKIYNARKKAKKTQARPRAGQ